MLGGIAMGNAVFRKLPQYQNARFDKPKNVSKKPSKNSSKMGPKSIKSRCWKPSKSVVSPFGLLESLKIDFCIVFDHNMVPKGPTWLQKAPKMKSKINAKSIPRPHGLSRGHLDGPGTRREPILDQFWTQDWIDF